MGGHINAHAIAVNRGHNDSSLLSASEPPAARTKPDITLAI
jgi:hypothetical protein